MSIIWGTFENHDVLCPSQAYTNKNFGGYLHSDFICSQGWELLFWGGGYKVEDSMKEVEIRLKTRALGVG